MEGEIRISRMDPRDESITEYTVSTITAARQSLSLIVSLSSLVVGIAENLVDIASPVGAKAIIIVDPMTDQRNLVTKVIRTLMLLACIEILSQCGGNHDLQALSEAPARIA